MIDFLRALVPPHLAGGSCASVVLPSRYAREASSQVANASVSTTAADVETVRTPGPASVPVTSLKPVATTVRSASDAASDADRSEPLSRVRSSADSLDRIDVAPTPSSGPIETNAHPFAAETRRPTPSFASPESEHKPGRANLVSPPPFTAFSKPSDASATTTQTRIESAAAAASPLSQAAISSRLAEHATARPVIHVTIDRIDIRAPATPARPAPIAKPRPAGPAVSLSDYLRGKQGGGSR